jgi:predicted ATPase
MAMLARLISTGVLLEQGYLFWDEPETSLNPKLIKTPVSDFGVV